MRNAQKALGRSLAILLGLAMVMLLANCSGDSIVPTVDQPASGFAKGPGWPGEEATGDGQDEAIDERLDLKWGVTEYVASSSGVIGNQGGDLEVFINNYTFRLEIGSGALTQDYGLGLQVTKGRNAFGENLAYVSFTPQNVTVSRDVSFVVRNPFSNAVRFSLYFWDGEYGWINPIFFSCDNDTEWVNFDLSKFGTYALLVSPIPFDDNNAS